jgi:hypothetical protein
MQGVNGATVRGNRVGNFETATGEDDRGLWLASGIVVVTSVSGNIVQISGQYVELQSGVAVVTDISGAIVSVTGAVSVSGNVVIVASKPGEITVHTEAVVDGESSEDTKTFIFSAP